MSHSSAPTLNVNELLESHPLTPRMGVSKLFWAFIFVGVAAVGWAFIDHDLLHFWNAYFVSLIFFMGLAAGSVAAAAIFQIVGAEWPGPLRRIAEAGASFLPWAYLLWATTYFGKEYLYPWATQPMPGREVWMLPNFVYFRFSLLLGVLFFMMWRFVRLSLRRDVGLLRSKAKRQDPWQNAEYDCLVSGWKCTDSELHSLQHKLSWNAPVVMMLYIVIYSLFAFEMVMSMDMIWYANMFGGFIFVGNIYLAWATIGLTAALLIRNHKEFAKVMSTNHFWDLGKLTFGFCMLWGYLFWAHFLPQWYGNLPEETQWMILRTREFPWKGWGWVVFAMCFVTPFIVLLSRDLKKTPHLYAVICLIIFCGVWGEKYLLVMPQWSPHHIPFNLLDIAVFLGFLGTYGLCIQGFLSKFPYVQISHPSLWPKSTMD